MSSPAIPPSPPRRRHLMDPNAPRRPSTPAAARSLTRVQRWVMSVLAVTTILHLAAGLVIAAIFLPDPTLSSQVGLNVIAAAFGMMGMAAGLAIHGHRILSPWLAVGLVPGLVGIWLTLG